MTLALVACAATAPLPAGQDRTRLTVTAALEQYAARPDATIPDRLKQQDFINFLTEYRTEAGYWIKRGPMSELARRERVAAALAVELVAASVNGSFDEYKAGKALVEWFCQLLSKQIPSEFERLAMLASLAAIQGAGDSQLFGIETGSYKRKGHIDHALARFPNDDQLKLARVVARPELRVISTVMLHVFEVLPEMQHNKTPLDSATRLNETLATLETLDGPRVRDEARLRRSVLMFVTGKATLAMQDFSASSVGEHRFAAYISNLMLGSIYYTSGDARAAAARYSKAMSLVPATSARLGLAAALMKLGDTDEAAAIAAPPAGPRAEDPWRIYNLGLFHELPSFLEAMRAALK